MQGTAALHAYIDLLKPQLEAKDVRAAGVAGATVLLSFPGDGVVTIDFRGPSARVLVGDQRERDPDARSLMVRTPLATWLALTAGTVTLSDADADVLGDPALFASVARLWAQKRSGVAARMFG